VATVAEHQPGLFEVFGIELEYMIVDSASLDVAPAADWLLTEVAGELTDEYEDGTLAWNNELALHVIEFKLNGPSPTLDRLPEAFQAAITRANTALATRGLQLMPTGMHPWMDPARDLKLWPHDSRVVYEAFDRIFGCRGHGWANLQSMHLNLPFCGDDEFRRLHTAIRLLMPVLPALTASSPVVDGSLSGQLDTRLAVYRNNCARIPSVTGAVIPEAMTSIAQYRDELLGRIYRDLAPHDPERVLAHEWVHARGAIARFDRMAIEIRVLDTQECPRADLAFARLIVATLRELCAGRWSDVTVQEQWRTADLARALAASIERAELAECADGRYLRALGLRRGTVTLHELWGHLAEQAAAAGWLDPDSERVLEHYLRHGSLATRISRAIGREPPRARIAATYRQLCESLAAGELWPG